MTRSPPEARAARRDRAEERREIARAREQAGRNVWWRRRLRILRRTVGGVALRLAAPAALRALARTWSVQREPQGRFEEAEKAGGFLIAMWHGRMLPALPVHSHRGIAVLVSQSDDGGLVKLLLERFGCRVIRGSTSKQGARALREMRDLLSLGDTVVITPDGPRGPRHGMNVGLAWLARETGLPILTLGVACDRAWRLHSWDRFLIPKPRARVVISYGELLKVPADAGEDELERVTGVIREGLLASEERAFASLGQAPDW